MLTYSDIQNKAEYSATSNGIGYSSDKGFTPTPGMPVSGDASSTTKSAIEAGATITITGNQTQDLSKLSRDTGNSLNVLGKIFDKKSVQEKQELAKVFGEEANKAIGDLAESMRKKAKTPEEKAKWAEGGEYKALLHAVSAGFVSGLTGNGFASGAAGDGISQLAQTQLAKITDPNLRLIASSIVGAAAAKAVGGNAQAGASAAYNGVKYNDYIHKPTAEGSIIHTKDGWFQIKNGIDTPINPPDPGTYFWEQDDKQNYGTMGNEFIKGDTDQGGTKNDQCMGYEDSSLDELANKIRRWNQTHFPTSYPAAYTTSEETTSNGQQVTQPSTTNTVQNSNIIQGSNPIPKKDGSIVHYGNEWRYADGTGMLQESAPPKAGEMFWDHGDYYLMQGDGTHYSVAWKQEPIIAGQAQTVTIRVAVDTSGNPILQANGQPIIHPDDISSTYSDAIKKDAIYNGDDSMNGKANMILVEGGGSLGGRGTTALEGSSKVGTLSNLETRQWYLLQEAKIPELINKNASLEKQAKQAFELRNEFRTQARELMADRDLAASLNKTDPNLTWEQVVQKYTEKGFQGDDLYREIVNSAQRSRTSVNKSLGIE